MPSGATLLRNPQKGNIASTKGKFRLDIQGLRAFAVIVVILDHMFAWPSGGFVGVDIFFVISGFLITGHLMREWEQTGQISFWKFYKGRIKRILPAATLVLAVTVGASFLLLNKSRAMSVLWDGVWATLFSGNWRFAAAGTDYFQADGPVSPLQHFWSLAVEEQFYFVWPWLMLLALLLVGRSRSAKIRPRVVAGLLIGAISAASFAWAMLETSTAPTMAYFSTFSRAWELGLGALLAIATPLLLKINHGIRPAIAWVGIAGMVASVFVINSSQAFPAPTALLPVLATVLVIAAGTGGEQRFLAPLANPVTKYIGNISYSLYLWHFPVIILVGPLLPWVGVVGYLVQIGIIAFVSVAAYHMWEDTIRKGPWLEGRQAWKKYKLPKWYGNAVLGVLAATTAICVGVAFVPAAKPANGGTEAASRPISKQENPAKNASGTPLLDDLNEEMSIALGVSQWPALSPSIDNVIAGPQADDEVVACGLGKSGEEACTWGNPKAKKTIVTVGNSLSMNYVTALREVIAKDSDWKLISYGMFGCPFGSADAMKAMKVVPEGCPERAEHAVAAINKISPDVVFLAGTHRTADVEMEKLNDGPKLVFVLGPPIDKDIEACYTRISTPQDCISFIPEGWGAEEQARAKSLGGTYIDSTPWFCLGKEGCPPFVGKLPRMKDSVHMSQAYAERIAPVIRETLKSKGIM